MIHPYSKLEEYSHEQYIERMKKLETSPIYEAFRMLAQAYMKKVKEMPESEERWHFMYKFADVVDARDTWLYDKIHSIISGYYDWDEAETEDLIKRMDLKAKSYKRLVELIEEKEAVRREAKVENPLNFTLADVDILRLIELAGMDEDDE